MEKVVLVIVGVDIDEISIKDYNYENIVNIETSGLWCGTKWEIWWSGRRQSPICYDATLINVHVIDIESLTFTFSKLSTISVSDGTQEEEVIKLTI